MTNFFLKMFIGRISRKQFLLPALFFVAFPYVYFSLVLYNLHAGYLIQDSPLLDLLFILFASIAILPVAVKRLHDIGWPGWLGVFMIIPVINILPTVFLLIKSGRKEINKYGAVPIYQRKKIYFFFWLLLIILFVFMAYKSWENKPWISRTDESNEIHP